MSSSAATAAASLEKCFFFDAVETSYEISSIDGTVPDWLRGCYYVNGPARFERGGARYRHWLDGDGMVASLRFTEDGVWFSSRFIQTSKFCQEEEAGQFLYRGFGTKFPGDRLRRGIMLEPPLNVSVYPYNGTLLAFGEQSIPYQLDPFTLETRCEYDFHGRLNAISPFSAHPKFDDHLVNFGLSYLPGKSVLNLYEFDEHAQLLERRRLQLGLPHYLHDFGLTQCAAVFYLSPLLMDVQRFRDGAAVMESLYSHAQTVSRILVVPRYSTRGESFEVETGDGHCLHLINCFEEGDELTLDLLELEEPAYPQYQPLPEVFRGTSRCRPVRYVIDSRARTIRERFAVPYDRMADFPSIDLSHAGARCDEFWMLGISRSHEPGAKLFDELIRASWKDQAIVELYRVRGGEYLAGEPVFIPNPVQPGEGVVIVEHLLPGCEQSAFLLLDAHSISHGPIARLLLKNRLHPGFHASFQPTPTRVQRTDNRTPQ
jgi:carotenoid cleavage dioxygenase-like enzyme